MPSQILWAGSDSALEDYVSVLNKFEATSPKDFLGDEMSAFIFGSGSYETESRIFGSGSYETESRLPRLLKAKDGVGVVLIEGTLTNRNSWYNRYAGLITYEEVKEAIAAGVSSTDIKELILKVGSPGGVVSGLADTYEFVREAAKKKRTTVFSDSIIASAAYWITAPVREKHISADAILGSIGAAIRHAEYSQQLKKVGVNATIIRSGKYKLLGHPMEKLSKLAGKTLQDSVDYTNSIFVQAVAESLGVSAEVVESKMGQGREFIGQQAVDVGLATSVSSYESLFAKVNKRVNKTQSGGGYRMAKNSASGAQPVAVTPEILEAVAAGVAPEELGVTAEALASYKIEAEAKAEAAAQEQEQETEEADVDTKAETAEADSQEDSEQTGEKGSEGSGDTEAETGSTPEVAAQVSVLQTQLSEVNDKLLKSQVALSNAEAQIESFKEAESSLKEIVGQVLNTMQVAMGGAATPDPEKLASKELLALHKAIKPAYVSSFKIGRVSAATDASDDEVTEETKTTLSRIEQAGLACSSFNK